MAARRRSHGRWDDLTNWEPSYNARAENEIGKKVPKLAEGPTFFEKVPLGMFACWDDIGAISAWSFVPGHW